MTTTHPYLSHPVFSKPDFYSTGPNRMQPLSADVAQMLAPLRGADSGYNTAGGVLVNRTADGVDLNVIWAEVQAVLAEANRTRSALASLISYPTVSVADPVSQVIGGAHFEEASEFGEPQGVRSAPAPLLMGYDFKDYDTAVRLTARFIRDATAEQVRNLIDETVEGDNRLVNGKLLRRLYDNSIGSNEFQHPVRPLWTGSDGQTPPPFAGRTFPASTTHMFGSGNTALDPGDLADLINAVQSKGYGTNQNSRLLLLCHPNDADTIMSFRRGVVTNGVESKYDSIPSAAAPPYLTEANVVGPIAPGVLNGLEVIGSHGPTWIVPSYYLPSGYVACVATGGPNSPSNPVAFRQHSNVAYTGLRSIPGRDQRYPLVESYFARSFGTGIRHRAGAAVVKIGASTTYTPPVWSWT